MLKIAVCDDEEFFRNKLENLLCAYCEKNNIIYHIDKFASGVALLAEKQAVTNYQIVFLDINMEEVDGIETAREIRKLSESVFIIFVTAFIQYSLEGYKVNAIRFLLKTDENLEIALKECMDTVCKKIAFLETEQAFDFMDGTKMLSLENIVYIESNLHKLIFHLKGNKKSAMYEKLDRIEKNLQQGNFCRIHQSYLVNLEYVAQMYRYQVVLYGGKVLNIAKVRYREVEDRFLLYKGEI